MRSALLRTAAVIAVTVVVAVALTRVQSRVVTSVTQRDPVYAGMMGQWQGTLEVADQNNSAHRVRRPARVRVQAVPESDALEMHYTTRSAAGADSTDTDRLMLDNALTAGQWGGLSDSLPYKFEVRVHELPTGQSPLRLVLEGEQMGDDIPSTVRQTVTIKPGEIRIVQERRAFGGEFEFERAYVLRRVG
jgi:hypothetical protein